MKIGYTPGQMAALDDVRAERARLESRGLSRRTMLATCLGFAVGAGAGAVLADVFAGDMQSGLGDGVAPSGSDADPAAPVDDNLLWALGLARTGTSGELAKSFEFYRTIVLLEHRRNPDLWLGIERLGRSVLGDELELSSRRKRQVALLIADLIRTEESSTLFGEHDELERRLRELCR